MAEVLQQCERKYFYASVGHSKAFRGRGLARGPPIEWSRSIKDSQIV